MNALCILVCVLGVLSITTAKDTAVFTAEDDPTNSRSALKGCLMTSCLNGGSCLYKEEKPTETECFCKNPWFGDRCEVKMDSTWYKVIVVTGSKYGAGTDAPVYIKIEGTKGEFERELDNKGDNFESGSADTFVFKKKDIGQLRFISVKRGAGDGLMSGWYLKEVRVAKLGIPDYDWNESIPEWALSCSLNDWVDKDWVHVNDDCYSILS